MAAQRQVIASDLKSDLEGTIKKATRRGGRAVVTLKGKPLAALVSLADLEWLNREDEMDVAAFDQAMAEDDGERIPHEEIVKMVRDASASR